LELQTKWFAETTPTNANKASASIGTGDNGTVTIEYDSVGTEGNDYKVAVAVASGANKSMAATLSEGVITVTLGTGADELVAAAKNTATLIAAAITNIDGFTAKKSGTGGDSISEATTEDVAFTGGTYCTPFYGDEAWLYIGTTYYRCSKPCDEYCTDAWQSVAFTTL
jgi:hypothetical protein